MRKTVAGLGGLVVIAGLAVGAGCTGGMIVVDEGPDGGARDGGTTTQDGGRRKQSDPAPLPDPSSPSSLCPSPAPTDDPPYKSARPVAHVCAQDIDTFIQSYIDQNPSATFKDLENAIAADTSRGGQACASCVFSNETDAAWGPIVYSGDGSSGGAFFDYGACFERAPGGGLACGKAVEQSEVCLDEVCSDDDCGSDQAKQQCVQEALSDTTSCGRYDVQAGCGSALTTLNNTCKDGLSVIKVMCAASGADAGG